MFDTITNLLRDLRGFIACIICWHTPLDRVSWKAFIWLMQYAGDWMYRETRWCPGGGGTARACVAAGTCGCDNTHLLSSALAATQNKPAQVQP